ncbi:two-component system response regulator YcbB [Bacillus thermophilus]|uniref:Two-component system response regulator YcbB n=1 Tax=Siminovitchia thermophila TaxID=1245522 RepID=A0ABS2R0P1_9BACI|nr:response regulator [Siminovitchia thermophila]MBM7713212.1 two-component system response regulator YcbB [Siminovitchia thermophila]
MLFYIVDDDEATRSMLTEMIEDEELGKIVGEAENGALLDEDFASLKRANILLIDLLMPVRDGIETIRHIKPSFSGKIIMISQVESKELVGCAYSHGVEYYITKPINRFEVISVIKRVIERIYLEQTIQNIHKSVSNVFEPQTSEYQKDKSLEHQFMLSGQYLLSKLGIVGENGYQDLLDILNYLFTDSAKKKAEYDFPHLKDIFLAVCRKNKESPPDPLDLKREIKAAEQRVRRAIYQSLNHLSALGLTDFANPIFEHYAPKFFDFTMVRKRMAEIKSGQANPSSNIRVNTKKFIQVLYFETQYVTFEKSR